MPSMCEQHYECPDCGILLKLDKRNPDDHECGETFCNICNEYYMEDTHYCYMRSMKPEIQSDKFIFYDFECRQDNDKGIHIPNFVVAQSICDMCESNPISPDAKCAHCGSRCALCNTYNNSEKEYENMPCDSCGYRQVIFKGDNTKFEFAHWLFSEGHKNVTAIAHNARGYDSYFLYDYLMVSGLTPDPVIFSGSKIMYMHVNNLHIRLIDSLNFLPMPLSKLPKSFGLTELKKGFFPHFYNTIEHQKDDLRHLPDMKYYDPDSMSKERRNEFLSWYAMNKDRRFNFQKEMEEYCISDVDILLKSCWKFRKLVMSATSGEEIDDFENACPDSVDPFAFLTIASVCMGVFRSKFLPEEWSVLTEDEAKKNPNCKHNDHCECVWSEGRKINGFSDIQVYLNDEWVSECLVKIVKKKFVKSPIGIIPADGYSGDRHSKASIEWLKLLEKQMKERGKNVIIQHARSAGGEKIVQYSQPGKRTIRYKLDGYFEYDGIKFACEFNGCNWHGCPRCYRTNRETVMKDGKSLAQRYRETLLKEKRLTEMGYKVISKWSCEFEYDLKESEIDSTFVQDLNIQDPINLRDCYFGGRTNALILHKEFKQDSIGCYYDFTSLYPSVMKYCRYPVGHPQRIVDNFQSPYSIQCPGNCMYGDMCEGTHVKLPYFGIIKAKFIAPRKLLHPILPIKINGKLMFPLCYKCAKNENQETECNCSEDERAFIHTYCTPEIETALNAGYIMSEIYEVLHWSETSIYSKGNPDSGLFTNYVNTFLQLKQQASGFPQNVSSEEDIEKYITNYEENEGIKLNRDLIAKNPGLRSISKLALNSFYGKFGQKTNMKKTKFISDIGVFFNTLTDNTKDLADFHIMNKNVILLEYRNSNDFLTCSGNTNVLISAFCTSWARLALWYVMNRLGDRVLYHDTDSIIFEAKAMGEYIPPVGAYLGDLTDELWCKELGCDGCDDGHWIVEFVSCGPKNYSFRLNTGEIVCKVRGFSLNYANSQIINFDSMKKSLFNWQNGIKDKTLQTVKVEIQRQKYQNPHVYTRSVKKNYRVIYDKRRVLEDYTTHPYGY